MKRSTPRAADRAANPGEYRGKRVLDLVLTVSTAPIWLFVSGICAVIVRADSPGPVLFKQRRVGRNGELFELYKFRSMVDDPASDTVFPDDSRITRVGRVLRRWSLDELPQLLNVVRGEMSLVGPRPTLEYQVERYDERQRGRLAARPGLTGLAQQSGRNILPWADRIELDLEYIRRQSLGLDLRLLVTTPLTVLAARGVSGHPTDDPLSAPPGEAT